MQYQIIPVTSYQQNCSLIWCDKTLQAAIVDPGGNADLIYAAVTRQGLNVKMVLLTHGHFDHIGAAKQVAQHYQVPIYGPEQEDLFLLESLPIQTQMYGFPYSDAFVPDRWLKDGDEIIVGEELIKVLHCPGHTPGHVVFFCPNSELALVGDVLFSGSVGRTDFPRGDFASLSHSIRTKLWPLGDQVKFISGHGPMSTIGRERKTNPFVGEGAMSD